MKLFHLALALIDITALVTAFSPHWKSTRPRTATRDIHEWRDIDFGFPGTSESRRLGSELGPPPKPICILPFPFTDILLQGETKQLRLYEDRFIKLFDCCMKEHGGVVGMGLMADSGIIQVIPLCEIEAYNRMDGFGIFVTIRVVGRAKLLEITQQEPYIQAVCTEMNDKLPPNLELPNLLASNVENFMLLLSSMEHRLEKVDDDSDGDDPKMRRRIDAARLVSRVVSNREIQSGLDIELTTDNRMTDTTMILTRMMTMKMRMLIPCLTDASAFVEHIKLRWRPTLRDIASRTARVTELRKSSPRSVGRPSLRMWTLTFKI